MTDAKSWRRGTPGSCGSVDTWGRCRPDGRVLSSFKFYVLLCQLDRMAGACRIKSFGSHTARIQDSRGQSLDEKIQTLRSKFRKIFFPRLSYGTAFVAAGSILRPSASEMCCPKPVGVVLKSVESPSTFPLYQLSRGFSFHKGLFLSNSVWLVNRARVQC